MKIRHIFAAVMTAAISLTMLAVSASAVSFPGAKLLFDQSAVTFRNNCNDKALSYFSESLLVGVLSKNGNLYTYDDEFEKVLVSKNVEWASTRFYLKKGILYGISTKTSVLKNVESILTEYVAVTTSGDYYFLSADKPKKLTDIKKKIYSSDVNGDGYLVLFATEDEYYNGQRYFISPEGDVMYYDKSPNS
jgi:hypothetical protein